MPAGISPGPGFIQTPGPAGTSPSGAPTPDETNDIIGHMATPVRGGGIKPWIPDRIIATPDVARGGVSGLSRDYSALNDVVRPSEMSRMSQVEPPEPAVTRDRSCDSRRGRR